MMKKKSDTMETSLFWSRKQSRQYNGRTFVKSEKLIPFRFTRK